MYWIQKTINFYINASIHVAVAIFCLLKITNLVYQVPVSCAYYLVVFFGSIFSYNVLKYHTLFYNTKNKKTVLAVTFLAFIFCMYFYMKLTFFEQLSLFLCAMLVVVYPFLRKIGWLKLFLVSFVVSFVTFEIPIFALTKFNFVGFTQRFLVLFGLLVPFEIVDSITDSEKMQTLPQRFGIKATKLAGYLAIGISFFLAIYCGKNDNKWSFYALNLLVSITSMLLLFFTSIERSKYYTLFWVESVPIFWCILLLFFT